MDAHVALRGVLGAALGCLALSAQSPWEALVQSMYAKFVASFDLAHDPGGTGEFMILANPGIGLGPATLGNPAKVSRLVDTIPRPAQLYVPSGYQVSTIYGRVVHLAEPADRQPSVDLEQARLARRLLWDQRRPGKPTKKYADYLKCQAEYATALDARSAALAEYKATGKAVPPGLDQAIAAARRAWDTLGNKAEVERAVAAVLGLYAGNAAARLENLQNEIEAAQALGDGGEPWFPVLATPPVAEWTAEKGWRGWRFQQSDLAQPAPGPALPLAAPGAGALPKAGPAGPASLSLTVELKRVSLTRAWLHLELFSQHDWRLPRNSPWPLVSAGDPVGPAPGPMPLVVVGLLLARKLSVTGTWSGDAGTGRGLPRSLGPFALAGARSTGAGASGGFSLKNDGPQIVGFIVQPVPRSPAPDPRLFPRQEPP